MFCSLFHVSNAKTFPRKKTESTHVSKRTIHTASESSVCQNCLAKICREKKKLLNIFACFHFFFLGILIFFLRITLNLNYIPHFWYAAGKIVHRVDDKMFASSENGSWNSFTNRIDVEKNGVRWKKCVFRNARDLFQHP